MRPNHVNCVGNVNKALYFFSTNISVPKGSSVSQNDLTFHDLRHEAISRMFDSGMKIHEVMAVSGHRTASQLFRYVQTVRPV